MMSLEERDNNAENTEPERWLIARTRNADEEEIEIYGTGDGKGYAQRSDGTRFPIEVELLENQKVLIRYGFSVESHTDRANDALQELKDQTEPLRDASDFAKSDLSRQQFHRIANRTGRRKRK